MKNGQPARCVGKPLTLLNTAPVRPARCKAAASWFAARPVVTNWWMFKSLPWLNWRRGYFSLTARFHLSKTLMLEAHKHVSIE